MLPSAYERAAADGRKRGRGAGPFGRSRAESAPVSHAGADEPIGYLGYRVGALGYIQVEGPIGSSCWGWPGRWIVDALMSAARHQLVERVVLQIDSPGGASNEMGELIEAMAFLRAAKPVHAIACNMAASLAVPLLTMATEASVTPTGVVGSVGTIIVGYDDTEALRRRGVTPHVVTTGEHKGWGVYGAELTPAMVERQRADAEMYTTVLAGAVSKYRGVPVATVRGWQGRTFIGAEAVAVGLADRVDTRAGLLRRVAEALQ